MAKKIANIVITHECEEQPCHLNNEEQTTWLEKTLPKEKLGWNWKLVDIKVFDVHSPDSNTTDSYISRILDNKDQVSD